MNEMKKGKYLFLCIPFLIGTAGFILAGEKILDAGFLSLCMYAMNVQDPPANAFLEAARWTAPVATASGLILFFSSLRDRIDNAIRYRKGDSIAVYGREEDRTVFLRSIGKKGIEGKEKFVQAQRYVLIGNEEDNLDFYQKNRNRIQNREVYMFCSSVRPQMSVSSSLHLVSPEEIAGRLYWKEHCLYDESLLRGHKMSIVLLGFGKLGENVLLYGLQDNIFSPDQEIRYHIFGDSTLFRSVHTQLESIEDRAVFHDEHWYDCLSLLEEAAAVLVLEQEKQAELVDNILLASQQKNIHVFSSDELAPYLFGDNQRVTLYNWKENALNPEYVLGGNLYERAKRINLRYAHIYTHIEENDVNKELEWEKLDGFTRYSNISSADYHEIQLKMLSIRGEETDVDKMNPECLELLSELEHIRWCRYHYLNNWRYGIPDNGRSKDPGKRIHRDLLPYRSISEAEKEKDRENIRVLFGT